jgi:hypothetical protein
MAWLGRKAGLRVETARVGEGVRILIEGAALRGSRTCMTI